MCGSKAALSSKQIRDRALCQCLAGVNSLMYEQCMKIHINVENTQADWEAARSDFQKAWAIWFLSRGNISIGINCEWRLTTRASPVLSQNVMYAQHVTWTFWSPALCRRWRSGMVMGDVLNYITEVLAKKEIKQPHNVACLKWLTDQSMGFFFGFFFLWTLFSHYSQNFLTT